MSKHSSSLKLGTRHLAPIVILDRPQMGENIGAVARAMMNFGMSELRLVNPRDGWPNAKAHEMSANADWIIEGAKVYPAFSEALADCQYVIAATARQRDMEIGCYTPTEAVEILEPKVRQGEKAAIVLGGERSGLENEDIAHCQAICTIPADPRMSSLNIAQSMVILGYEWWMAREGMRHWALGIGEKNEMSAFPFPNAQCLMPNAVSATQAERQALYEHAVSLLEQKGYYQHEGKTPVMQRNLRGMISRLPLTSQQIQSLRGMLRALVK